MSREWYGWVNNRFFSIVSVWHMQYLYVLCVAVQEKLQNRMRNHLCHLIRNTHSYSWVNVQSPLFTWPLHGKWSAKEQLTFIPRQFLTYHHSSHINCSIRFPRSSHHILRSSSELEPIVLVSGQTEIEHTWSFNSEQYSHIIRETRSKTHFAIRFPPSDPSKSFRWSQHEFASRSKICKVSFFFRHWLIFWRFEKTQFEVSCDPDPLLTSTSTSFPESTLSMKSHDSEALEGKPGE